MIRRALLAAVLAVTPAVAPAIASEPPLPAPCIDEKGVSVSGLSSGGFMAHQLHVAHSAGVMGAGVFAGGPWRCAGGDYPASLFRALTVCSAIVPSLFLGPPDAQTSIAGMRAAAAAGEIDDPAGLRGDPVLLFAGRYDELVPSSVLAAVAGVYRAFDDAARIALIDDVGARHAMPTLAFGNPCDSMQPPFINACGYDLAGATLRQLYGPLAPPKSPDGDLRPFAQGEFVDPRTTHGLAERGWIYIPEDCGNGGCRLHVVFHGCLQNEAMVGDAFVRRAGYNEWAEANRIVVLYPQTAVLTTRVLGIALPWPNPQGCWDWWGYTGPDYATKHGPQIKAVNAMIDRLASGSGLSGSSAPGPSCARAGGG